MEGTFGDVYDIDDEDDIYGMVLNTTSLRDLLYQSSAATKTDALSGVLIEELDRGTHRGTRSFDALVRRFTNWKSKQVSSRRDFRAWKSHYKDSTLRTHGDQNPKPLVCPKPAVQVRLRSQAKNFNGHSEIVIKKLLFLSLLPLT